MFNGISELGTKRLAKGVEMKTVSDAEICKNLSTLLDEVVESSNPVLITRQNKGVAVLMSLAEYSALEETQYLMKNPVNAKRLIESIDQIKKAKHNSRWSWACALFARLCRSW